jgi:hypothetical protein
MTNSKKITKRENLGTLLDIVDKIEAEGFVFENEDMTCDTLREFINHEIELLDNKAAAAAKRAQAKREEGDALRAHILDLMSTEDFMTIKEIVKAIGDEDVSDQMVTARLTQAVRAGLVEKEAKSVEVNGKTKKLSCYRKLA